MKLSILFLAGSIVGNCCLAQDLITPDRAKVDAQGAYLPFPGFTMVADLAPNDVPFFQALYDRLAQIPKFKEYYELLPLSSAHMTTINLYTKYPHHAETWDKFISEKLTWFQKVNHDVEKDNLYPKVKLSCLKGLRGVSVGVELNKNDEEKIKILAKKYEIENKIPAYFHISLAYLKKDIPRSDWTKLMIELNTVFSSLLKELNYKEKILTLKRANLTYFPDMKSFVPWNGLSNPFMNK
jgi:hypothetical protein